MLGELISAGTSVLGGLLQRKEAKKQAALQREFAQNAVQWKVEDAKKAGVHPLYALGANTVSYAPQSVGDLGVSQAGQNIGRAVDTALSGSERASAVTSRVQQLQLENMELQNAKLASEIRLSNQAGSPSAINEPGIIAGQGNSRVTAKEMTTIVNKSAPHHEPVGRPENMWTRLPDGGYAANPSAETAEAMESNPLGQIQYGIRNGIVPMFTQKQELAPPASWLPKGATAWRFNAFTGAWYPYTHKQMPKIRSKGTIR